jgi:Amt family ammonium transporter
MPLTQELGNIIWLMLTASLVMLMQAGFCCLESGLSRAKNSINVALKNLIDFCIAGVLFWAVGFGFMFGQDFHGFIGTNYFIFNESTDAWMIAFFLFQFVFCGTSTTIVSGVVAERMKFVSYIIVSVLISGFIYPIFGHWAWGGVITDTNAGWLKAMGFIDFAGSTVVHSVGGWVALVAAIVIGPRIGRFENGGKRIQGHNYPLSALGVLLLWFGWFGFNGGSTLVIDQTIPRILLNTNLSAIAGGISALMLSWFVHRKPEVGEVMNGIIAGLVGITASCYIMTPVNSLIIGASSGVLCLLGTYLLERLKIDDVVSAIPAHAFCGAWGTIAVALFADPAEFGNGLTRWEQLQVQVIGVVAGMVWSCGVTFAALKLIQCFMTLRVSKEDEIQGLNYAEHMASTELNILLNEMNAQTQLGDFTKQVAVEPHTEVGQIAEQYNCVMQRVSEEIIQREQVMHRLLVAEEKYRSIFENATEGIFRITPSGRILDANVAMAKILGYNTPAHLITSVPDFSQQHAVEPEEREEYIRKLNSAGYISDYETRLKRCDNSIAQVSMNVRVVKNGDSHIDYYEGSLSDLSVRQEAEKMQKEKEAAEAANRAKSQFLANMSHEIRTPLNGVIGMLDLLSESQLTPQQFRYSKIAKSSAHTLLNLINDILDFSKIEAGKLELEYSEFDLPMLMEDLIDMFGHRANQKELEFTCQVMPQVANRVLGDQDRLRQVLINLIGNAIKFTDRGNVVVRLSVIEHLNGIQKMRFEVEDSGIGISEDVQSKLFRVFEQADASTTRKYGGTGLGLAICRQLVELMGGTIQVKSVMGKGTTFYFDIPLKTIKLATQYDDNIQSIRGMKVLAIDDNDTNLEILESQLKSWGTQVSLARTAYDGFRQLIMAWKSGETFDLLILDHQMPEVDGIELARLIHESSQLEGLPIILLTSNENALSNQEMSDIGIRGYCIKPISTSRLYNVIVTCMSMTQHLKPLPSSDAVPAIVKNLGTGCHRILIAEDNEINQMVTQEILEKAGYQCRVANNGLEAVELIKKRPFDLILMDCQMPTMDGFTAASTIRSLEQSGDLKGPNHPIPIIALTANALKGDHDRCLASGMVDYVSKPVDPQNLLNVIQKQLQGKAAVEDTIAQKKQADIEKKQVSTSTLNYDLLRDKFFNDDEFIQKILQMFLERVPDFMSQLINAYRSGNMQETLRVSHEIKGVSSNISAMEVSETAGKIEEMVKKGQYDQLPQEIEILEKRMEQCVASIEDIITEAGSFV